MFEAEPMYRSSSKFDQNSLISPPSFRVLLALTFANYRAPAERSKGAKGDYTLAVSEARPYRGRSRCS